MNSNFTLKKIIIVIFGIIMFYVLFAIYSDIEKLKENYQQINLVYLFPIILICKRQGKNHVISLSSLN